VWQRWARAIREWAHKGDASPPRIGLALGGGFARGLAHIGVLEVFEENQIPIHAIAGISAGAIIGSAFASGTPLSEIISKGARASFSSYARWTVSKLGLATNERMESYLRRVLRRTRFEEMDPPLAVVATDLGTGSVVVFKGEGDIIAAVRASCAYPGLFLPVEIDGRLLVDGAMSATVPVEALREMGATRVVAVSLQTVTGNGLRPTNMFQVVHQCFAIMQERTGAAWRRAADLVIEPQVARFGWNDFESGPQLVEAGRQAALAALPQIKGWLEGSPVSPASAFPESRTPRS
jgi:NTE family protein